MKNHIVLIGFTLCSLVSCTSQYISSDNALIIPEIQGCGHISPYDGKIVQSVKGIVTHKFSNGFSMQSQTPDDRDCTSEGIFVFTENYPDVFPGDLVAVDGKVDEFNSGKEEDYYLTRTEIHDPQINLINKGNELPEVVDLTDPNKSMPEQWIDREKGFNISTDGLDYYESLEFMLVEVKSGLVVGPKNSFNEFIVLPESKIASNLISPQRSLLQKVDDENPEKIMVDAASSFSQNVNSGDRFTTPIIGIMDYSFGNYKIWTISDPKIIKTKSSKTSITPESKDNLSIVSYNLENFSLYDKESRIRGISCQIVKDLSSPDILLLHEVMDDSGTIDDKVISSENTLKRLSDEINDCGGPIYAYSDNPPLDGNDGGIDGGNIRSVLFYRTDRGINLDPPEGGKRGLRFEQEKIILSDNPLRLFENENEFMGTRKPAVWLISWNEEQYLIMGLHLVSQAANSPEWGSIQPPLQPELEKRIDQAKNIATQIASWDQLASNVNILLVGDLNDYSWSSTLKELESAPIINIGSLVSDDERYSYIHEGNSFQFDYALVNRNLGKKVESFTIAHINTPFSDNLQLSDHDPIYIEISSK